MTGDETQERNEIESQNRMIEMYAETRENPDGTFNCELRDVDTDEPIVGFGNYDSAAEAEAAAMQWYVGYFVSMGD